MGKFDRINVVRYYTVTVVRYLHFYCSNKNKVPWTCCKGTS